MKNLQSTLTPEEITLADEKAKEIANKEGVPKVHPFIFVHPETFKRVHAFLREPTLSEKVYAMDNVMRIGMNSAALLLAEQLILKGYSDQITYSDSNESDPYKLGIMQGVIERIVNVYVEQYNVTKKNMKLTEQAMMSNTKTNESTPS